MKKRDGQERLDEMLTFIVRDASGRRVEGETIRAWNERSARLQARQRHGSGVTVERKT